jgi:hypothetical protein
MEHYTTRDRESTFSGTGSSLTVNDEKLKYPKEMANAFNNFFITITEKLNTINRERRRYLNSKR